jgi:hypothetical protein
VVTAAYWSASTEETVSATQETARSEEAEGAAMLPGLYGMGDAGQIYAQTRINEDGTYVDMDKEGTPVGGGTWEVRGDLTCFDPEGDGEEQQEKCWTREPADEDGSFITTRDDGSASYRVTPLEEPAAQEMATEETATR